MKRVISYILLFLLISTSLYAQQKSGAYYEDRQKDYKYIPPIGTMFIYGGRIIGEYYDENNVSADMGSRVILNMYAGYESLGIYLEVMAEYQTNTFSTINNFRENFGYDAQLLSNFETKGKIYLRNFYILQRNLSYYFGPYLQTIRIGKLWIDYSPYTIYRTWGPEGISLEGNIVSSVAKYNIFYSYNRVVFTKYDSLTSYSVYTNKRNLVGGKITYNNSKYINGELIGVYYNAIDYKKEDIESIKLGRDITETIYGELLDVEKHHTEIMKNEKYYGYVRKFLLSFNFLYFTLDLSYRLTSPDFMPYDRITWSRYEPETDPIYDWIYEEERPIRNNEKAYNLSLKYNIGGLNFITECDWASWLDKNRIDDWLTANSPGFIFKTSVNYLVGWITITHKFWQKIYKGGGITQTINPEKLQIYTTELYVPLTASLNLVPRVEYFRKLRSNNIITDKIIEFLQINYSTASIKFVGEIKISDSDMNEPAWLKTTPYYREQSWGIDNYIRLRMEYRF